MSGNFLKHLDCDLECPGCIMNQEKVQEILSETVHLKKLRYRDSEKVFKRGEPIIVSILSAVVFSERFLSLHQTRR